MVQNYSRLQTHFLFVVSVILMIAATAFGLDQTCVDSLSRVVSSKTFVGRIREKLPYFFLVPVPRMLKPLNHDLVEVEKQKWNLLFVEAVDNARANEMSFNFSTLESKIAFLESLEALSGDGESRILMFKYLRKEFDAELVRRLSFKSDGLLSKDDIEDLMDIYYLASNSSGYSISNLKKILVPGSDLQKAIRTRWQTEFMGTDLFGRLSRMNLIRKQDSVWSQIQSRSSDVAYWLGSVGLNLMSILTIGTPTYIPRWNQLEVWSGEEAESKKSLNQYEQDHQSFVKNEYRVGWLRKFLPIIVAGSLTINSALALNHLWDIDHGPSHHSIPQMTHLKTRPELEGVLKSELARELAIQLGRPLTNEELYSIGQSVDKMHLQEIGRALKERQKF